MKCGLDFTPEVSDTAFMIPGGEIPKIRSKKVQASISIVVGLTLVVLLVIIVN